MHSLFCLNDPPIHRKQYPPAKKILLLSHMHTPFTSVSFAEHSGNGVCVSVVSVVLVVLVVVVLVVVVLVAVDVSVVSVVLVVLVVMDTLERVNGSAQTPKAFRTNPSKQVHPVRSLFKTSCTLGEQVKQDLPPLG
jgi:hypothetical protein